MPTELPPPLADLFASRAGVATFDEVRSVYRGDLVGLLAHGGLVRATRRLLVAPSLTTALTPLRMALARSDSAVASDETAAVLWGADAYGLREERARRALARPQVTLLPGRTAPGCACHQTDDLWAHELASVHGVPCTDPARTLCDLGRVASPDLVERVLEWALRNDQTSVKHLEVTIDRIRRHGRRGPGVLAALLDRRGARTPPTESDAETVFLQATRRPGQPEPIRQRPVAGPDGSSYRVDFAFEMPWLPAPVWVEIDGLATHTGRDALISDLHRQNALMRVRPVLLRFTSADVYRHPAYVRQETWRHLTIRT